MCDGFFTEDSAASTGTRATANFTSPTWLVQMEGPGVRKVYHYPKGFKFLNFHSVYGKPRVPTESLLNDGQKGELMPSSRDDSRDDV